MADSSVSRFGCYTIIWDVTVDQTDAHRVVGDKQRVLPLTSRLWASHE